VAEEASTRVHFTWEMSITREEFLRTLPAAVNLVPYQIIDERIEFRERGRYWRVGLERLPDRSLGSLKLEYHRVSFEFEGYLPREVARFMRRFELHFRRGGG